MAYLQRQRAADADHDGTLVVVQANEVGQAVRPALALKAHKDDVFLLQAGDLGTLRTACGCERQCTLRWAVCFRPRQVASIAPS